ncbi:MAG TPA: hypothetical protein PKK43_03750 [Spirochaetota bacterium]|nr:hypothetical protein [Spirochaetota bacterium]
MKISQLAESLKYQIVVSPEEDREVETGYTSDLLSDVMGNAEEGSVLITIQAHRNTIAVAQQLEFPAIIICNNRPVPSEMESSAVENGIAVMRTEDNQFVTSYKVYHALHMKENDTQG